MVNVSVIAVVDSTSSISSCFFGEPGVDTAAGNS